MKVQLSWLSEFVDLPVEPKRLGEDLTMAGLALDGLEADGRETILDLDITTNRVDCMNVYGVAREVSVIYGVPLRPPAVDFEELGPPAAEGLEVAIEASDLCPRFCARVLDVRLQASPAWVRDRLERAGVRPINNVVDLTNYVMLELGHPSHAFDLAEIPGRRLIARWGREGERLTTLDGVERVVGPSPRIGFVACPEGPLAVAGVMGGAASEVGERTRAVALEAAYWDPLSIRRAAKALGLHTEASHRFERGADPEAPPVATARIAHLLGRIGAGTTRPGLIDRHGDAVRRRRAPLRSARVAAVLGAPVPEQRAHSILDGLGFRVAQRTGAGAVFEVPTWRGDVSREIDLVEEVARHNGLARIPSRLPAAASGPGLTRAQRRERKVRDTLVAAGFTEVITLSFLPEDGSLELEEREPVRLANPLAEDQARLRRSLVYPGLLGCLRANLRQGRRNARLFEIGRVFLPAQRLAREELRLGVLLSGEIRPAHWSEPGRRADIFDLKGLLSPIGERLGLPRLELQRGGLPGFLHPGKSALVLQAAEPVGYLGALHPDVVASADLKDEALVAELRLAPLLDAQVDVARFQPIARHPAVARDLSVLCDLGAEAAWLLERVRAAAGPLLRSVAVTDRYEGSPVPAGKVSLMLRLRYQDPQRTLRSEEVEESVAGVVAELRRSGAEIRGE